MKATVKITLDETLKRVDKTRNAIAVEGKIRPATLSELSNGKSKSISFDTLEKIITTLNELTGEKHSIEDVIKIEYEKE